MRHLLCLLASIAFAALVSAQSLETVTWQVGDIEREGLLHVPAGAAGRAVPLVFVFHGHGGSMRQAARSQPVHTLWPDALVVYLQGLPTPGQLTDPEGRRSGWQGGPGDQGDRDLAFVDVVLADLHAKHRIDPQRIYATGHSNGGGFTYLLWATRRDLFAAFGPSAAIAARNYGTLAPAPVIHTAGENDALVKFAWQQQMIASMRRTHQCGPGQPRGDGLTYHPSPLNAPVLTYIHSGGHRYPAEATALIVEFFKSHARQ